MKTSGYFKRNTGRMGMVLLALSALSLGGCAVYDPYYPYGAPYGAAQPVYPAEAVYAAPGPVYAAPAPVYVGPPASFSLGIYSGRGWYGGHRHGYGRGHGFGRGHDFGRGHGSGHGGPRFSQGHGVIHSR